MNTNERPSFISLYLQFARTLALRSTCRRLKVGAVLTTTDFRKVVSLGYNGNARKLANDCDSDEPGKCGCLHAEENAVIKCDIPAETEKFAFCTHQPCVMCAKRLINMGGLKRLYYIEPYRSPACGLLSQTGVECIQYEISSEDLRRFEA